MSKIISVHSFRGGTGKSNLTANLAAQLAVQEKRVGVIDTDIQSPGIHVLFGLGESEIGHSLNDFLSGKCGIGDTAHDVTRNLEGVDSGAVFLVPSSSETDEIVNILREGYDVSLLTEGFRKLIDALALDFLIIDTHPGLNEETLFAIAISHGLVVVMRPDHQDYEGTAVTVEVARSLEVPDMMLVVNNTPTTFDVKDVEKRVKEAYSIQSVFVLPHSAEMMILASGGVFSLQYPHLPLSDKFREIASALNP